MNLESQIQIYYQMMKNIDKSTDFEKEKSKNRNLTSPNMSINIRSSVPMEVTVTNTCLDVLNNLVKVGNNVFYSVQWKCEGKMCFVHMLQYFTTAFRDLFNSTKQINPENIYALSILFWLKVRLVKSIIFYNSLLQSFILSESHKNKLEMLTYTGIQNNEQIVQKKFPQRSEYFYLYLVFHSIL